VLWYVFRSCVSELVLSFDMFFKSLCSRMKCVLEVITMGGGLPDLLEASCPGRVFSAPVVSVYMSVLWGLKNLRVDTAFGGSLTAVDVRTILVDFLADCEVSSKLCLLRFLTSWKSSSWAVDSNEILFIAPLCFAVHLGLQFNQCYRVHALERAKKQLAIQTFAKVCSVLLLTIHQ
jgi:hypothetical protein